MRTDCRLSVAFSRSPGLHSLPATHLRGRESARL